MNTSHSIRQVLGIPDRTLDDVHDEPSEYHNVVAFYCRGFPTEEWINFVDVSVLPRKVTLLFAKI